MTTSSPCRSCDATMWWALTAEGKSIPLDDGPTPDGNLAVHRDHNGVLHARGLVLDEAPLDHEHRATSHFATCPQAAEHRRRK